MKKTKTIDEKSSSVNELCNESYTEEGEGKENKNNINKNKNVRIRLPGNIIKLMDEHIKSGICDKPSILFDTFKSKYVDTLDEMQEEQEQEQFDLKLKKSFKNRCFKIKLRNK